MPSPVERKHGGRRFLVEKRTMKGTSSPNAGPDGTGRVSVFQKDGNTYTVEPNGASILHFADRCPTLTDIPEDQGHTVLPFSRVALRLWQEAVPCAAARAVPSIRQPVWGLPRLQDLCTVVQVPFLREHSLCKFLPRLPLVSKPCNRTKRLFPQANCFSQHISFSINGSVTAICFCCRWPSF